MARPLRIDIPGGLYHVTSRGLECRAIVYENRDREHWLELLDRDRRLPARIRRCHRAIEPTSRVKPGPKHVMNRGNGRVRVFHGGNEYGLFFGSSRGRARLSGCRGGPCVPCPSTCARPSPRPMRTCRGPRPALCGARLERTLRTGPPIHMVLRSRYDPDPCPRSLGPARSAAPSHVRAGCGCPFPLDTSPLGRRPRAETDPLGRLYHNAMSKEPKADYDPVMRQFRERFHFEPQARTSVRFWLYLERLSHELEEPTHMLFRNCLDLLRHQRKARTYPRLWLYLAARRSGQDPGDVLAAHLDVLGANEWPRPIYRMHLGQLSPDDCLDAVPDHETGWKCQAHYHIAMVHLLAGDTARATEQLRACLAIRADDLDEYACAQADLRRLGSGTATKGE